jgi:site-specific recombinase XerD
MRLSTGIRRFDTQLTADGKSEHTLGAYLRDLGRFKDWLRMDPDVSSITPANLARYLATDSNRGPAVSVNRTKTALRMFFKFLAEAAYIESNPARLTKNGCTEPKTPEYFKPAEANRFLQAIPAKNGPVDERDRMMFTLLLHTGIRLGGLVKIRVKHVRSAERLLKVNGKGGIERSVYLTSKLRRALKSYIAKMELKPDDPLFPSRRGGPLGRRRVQLRFHHWLAKAGIKRHLTVHSLRHTFAMNLYRQTGDLRLVQAALGHRHISVDEKQAWAESSQERVIARLVAGHLLLQQNLPDTLGRSNQPMPSIPLTLGPLHPTLVMPHQMR